MKRYDSYKDSGIEWIGEIPEHWNVKRIKLITPVKRGASPRPIDDPIYFDENGEYAWVRIADVSASNRYLTKTTQILSDLGASLSVKREPGDFFLSIAGTVGKPMITNIKCCIHDGFVWFPDLTINAEYLYYIFETGMPYLGLGKLGTQLNLNTETVGNISIPFPKKNEIDLIVNYLDQKTTQIDDLISKKQRLIELMQEERTAMINQVVTKGLPAEAAAKAGLNPNVKMKDSGIEWLGEIPEHWEVKKLRYVFENKNTVRVPLSAEERGLMKERIYDYYGASGVIDQVEAYLFDEQLILIGEDGANLVTRSKRLAFIADGKYWVNNHAHVIKPRNGNINYFCELLELIDYTIYITGSAQPKLTQEALMSIKIIDPPLVEQNEIWAFVSKEQERIDTIITKTNQEIDLLKEYKTALISEVVTGKVKVIDN